MTLGITIATATVAAVILFLLVVGICILFLNGMRNRPIRAQEYMYTVISSGVPLPPECERLRSIGQNALVIEGWESYESYTIIRFQPVNGSCCGITVIDRNGDFFGAFVSRFEILVCECSICE